MRTRSCTKSLISDFKRKKYALLEKKKLSKKSDELVRSTRITRKSKTCFMDLNDDCIEEILRRLPAVELCKFTILSKRLKGLAEDMFKRLYSIKTITFKPTETCATEFGSKITRLFMKSFGSYMQQIQLIGTEDSSEKRMEQKMLTSIGSNCGPNLQCINLVRCDLNENTVRLLEKTLEFVPQITLDGCRLASASVDVYDLLLKKCHRLRTLNIIQCNTFDHGTWLRRRYSTLKTVQVLRAIFEPEDVRVFFELNPHITEVWFNVRMPQLTHQYDSDKLQRFLMINGFDEGNYCERFLNTYAKIVVKSLTLGHNVITERKCMAIAQMTDIRELKFIEPNGLNADFVDILSKGLDNLTTVFLSGEMFNYQMIQDLISQFPRLAYLYLHNTEFNSISSDQFSALIMARKRSATIETENRPLTIFVGRSTPVYARAMCRKFKDNKIIKVVTMKSKEFQSHFFLAK
ncbi:uncharacterized protein LOC116342627 [Contarinia nasturtii]|uniref:uncharacterized protein LOC116342627 n=1 Tax=Contarinia nasturtii TaxID=265458 RepID=UPI0012D38299|nr:uncharacterized protein LOC116342627 [Contarinia nasturtii]